MLGFNGLILTIVGARSGANQSSWVVARPNGSSLIVAAARAIGAQLGQVSPRRGCRWRRTGLTMAAGAACDVFWSLADRSLEERVTAVQSLEQLSAR